MFALKKIKILDVVFTNEIEGFEIAAFRGAIAELVGFENTLYHNHIDDKKVVYSYPLIQYKTKLKKASFTCIANGVDEAREFFINKNWKINISGKTMRLEIDTFQLRNGLFDVGTRQFQYRLKKWMPLNQANFKKFISLKSQKDKVDLLESILIGNILSMGKSLDWTVTEKIKVSINEVLDEQKVTFKKNSVITFDILFVSNAQLPINIGLGKGVSHGFGIIQKKTKI